LQAAPPFYFALSRLSLPIVSERYVVAMRLMNLVEHHPDYVEEGDSQKATAVKAVCHSRINSVVKINIYVGGTSGGDVESMIPVREIS
jgi:hypothetical protein